MEHGQGVSADQTGYWIGLTLRLPRDRMSVPVVRHLTHDALGELGAASEAVDDIDLALSEACANVVDHSGPGDAYDVSVTIGPSRCEIRVIDIGHGFDHLSLSSAMAASHAEHGRGVALMHSLMDEVRLKSEPEVGTVVRLVKSLDYPEAAPAQRLLRQDARQG